MKIKIYDMKRFFHGILFLLPIIISTLLTVIGFEKSSFSSRFESLIFLILLALIGIGKIYQSMNYDALKEDKKNHDERQQLIAMKSDSRSFNIVSLISIVLTILCSFTLVLTQNLLIGGILIGFAIMLGVIMITGVISSFYYNKRS